jgi:hypothetical protein
VGVDRVLRFPLSRCIILVKTTGPERV